jgi:YegS/Rv2252/BmrU family lipid kinase
MKYFVIVNPISGRGNGEKSIPVIEKELNNAKLDFELRRTEGPWDAAELAQKAAKDGYDVVVACGGDGTVNEVVNGLMLAKADGADHTALGVIGVGRGNDFAFSMGVPDSLEDSCQALANNLRRTIDIGHVTGDLYPKGFFPDGRYFGNGLGVGFDAVVGFEALKMKRLHGFINYVVAAIKTIFLYFNAPTVRLVMDDKEETLPSLMVSVMNGRRAGGGFMMAPEASSDDGLFDLCIAEEVSRPQMFPLITRFMAGTQAEHDAIRTDRTRKITVTALNEDVLPAHVDGETLSIEAKELTAKILPQQLDLIVDMSA